MASDKRREARVISVLGSKGGVRQTIIAVNLAISLKEETQKEVALVDLDLQVAGEIALLLNLPLRRSLVDLVPLLDRLDASLIKGYLSPHESGIDLLYGISSLTQRGQIKPSHIEKFLPVLCSIYDYIVVNTETSFTNTLIAALDHSDLILLITTADLLSLNDTKQTLKVFQTLHFPLPMIKILLNMSNIKGAINTQKVESYLGQEIFGHIPYDTAAVVSSINEGVPAMISAPRSHFSDGIREVALTLIQENKRYLTAQKGLFAEVGELLAAARPKRGEAAPVLPSEEEVVEIKPRWDETVINLKSAIHKRLLEEMDLKSLDLRESEDPKKREEVRETTKSAIEKILAQKADITLSRTDRTRLVLEILDEVLGLGPLEDFLRDTTITEIMVNGKDKIYIEQKGKLYLSNKRFVSNDQLLGIIRRIVAPLGRRIDESSPMVDARLKDGSRVNAIIPPLAIQGPMLTIRKFPGKRLTAEDWIKLGSINSNIVEFIRVGIQARQNIIISGGTSSGKTTLLNIASSFIPTDERIVTIEDSAELKLEQEHVVTLESRPPNIEGKGAVPIRQLVINSLRMRPDRIVVGECRGGEALDMLQAMNTGHDGSLTTVHANSPRDVLSRLETMVLMAGMELPIRAIRDQVVAAIDIIVHLARFLDGSRRVIKVTEVTGMEGEIITLSDIFKFKQIGVDEKGKVLGEFQATGVTPTFTETLEARGISLDRSIFQPAKERVRK